MAPLVVDQVALRRAWESSQRSTKEDWAEWLRYFAVELLRESPSPALRATQPLAQARPAAARAAQGAGFSVVMGARLSRPRRLHRRCCFRAITRLPSWGSCVPGWRPPKASPPRTFTCLRSIATVSRSMYRSAAAVSCSMP